MLVGEHGRVIPFRRFKEFAIGVLALTVLSIGALAILALLYVQQGRTIARLEKSMTELKQQNATLRNEKDVLLAKVVINKAPETLEAEAASAKLAAEAEDNRQKETEAAPEPTPAPRQEEKKEVVKTEKLAPKPAVQWGSEIQQYSTEYDAQRQILTTKFRLINLSKPKQALSGRIVVVYKNDNDPPIKWLAVPHVPLNDGKPVGDKGQAFQVRNYRTMTFRAYQLQYPIPFDTASVFVFQADGELILAQDFGIKIAAPPTPTPSPTPAPPAKEEPPSSDSKITGTSTGSSDKANDVTTTSKNPSSETPGKEAPVNGQKSPAEVTGESPMDGGKESTEAQTPLDEPYRGGAATGNQTTTIDNQNSDSEQVKSKPEGEKE